MSQYRISILITLILFLTTTTAFAYYEFDKMGVKRENYIDLILNDSLEGRRGDAIIFGPNLRSITDRVLKFEDPRLGSSGYEAGIYIPGVRDPQQNNAVATNRNYQSFSTISDTVRKQNQYLTEFREVKPAPQESVQIRDPKDLNVVFD